MSWVDEVLKGAQDHGREQFDLKKKSVRNVYESYRKQGLDPDEARILTHHTFNERFMQERDFIDLQEALIENYIWDMYMEDMEDE